jgi:hypothetical protein
LSEDKQLTGHSSASEYFQDFIKENFGDDRRPAEIRHLAELYRNMISVLDCVFAIGQAMETMPLTSQQRFHFDQMKEPLDKLMSGIGEGVTNLAPERDDDDGEA